jgi:hypothetical protein
VLRSLPALILLASLRPALGGVAADVDNAIQHATLDPSECYRVVDLNFSKEDLKVYLESGYLVFAKPVRGTRLGAVFVASADGGDADVLLLPPTRSERASLATFTNSPNLEEHFKSAALVFTDGTGEELLARFENAGSSRKSPEMGGLIVEKWNSVFSNLMSSFETRVVHDVLSGERGAGLFYMGVAGEQLGDFDVVYDPTGQDQIRVGKLAYRGDRAYFNVWTTFQARSFRTRGAVPRGAGFALDNFRIDATIQPDLSMQAVTRSTLTVEGSEARSIVPFNLTPAMRVTSASIDGRPAEIFDSESLRSNLMQATDDRQFLLVPETALEPGTMHEIEIHHAGSVIRDAGNQVYYVGSRGTWYPRTGGGLANYDLTFRYPKDLTLAATGARVNDGVDGDGRISHLKTGTSVRFAGFNLGHFQSVVKEHNGYRIEVYANERLESALAPKPADPEMPRSENPFRPHRLVNPDSQVPAPAPPDPGARMEQLTSSLEDTLDFMTEEFGPSPIRNLAVTPIPGGFGQGFPGLVYLSTLAYLDPSQFPARLREPSEETFYSELLEAHEVAHQWWGNLVVPASYHDDWLIESLANYSALMMLERKKGVKALDSVLDLYRAHLLSKAESGRSLESSGPIIWGYRLTSSLAPSAWQAVTYEKGTWIIHMLRRRMGDEKFLALLRELASRHRSISTEEFRRLASAYAPQSPDPGLKIFFDNWVYGTGIPAVKLSYTWRGGKLTGKIVQSDVDGDFSAYVPVEVESRNASTLYWLATGSDPAAFSIPLKAPPAKVELLAADCLMTLAK